MEIVERLEDERPKVRAEAAADLVELCRADPEARERFGMRFLTLLSDESPAVRGQAVVGAIVCDDELAHVDRVARLLEDPSPGVRLQVIHTLGPLGLPEVAEALVPRLRDEDLRVRTTAASALAFGGDARGLDVLVEALEKRATREEALHALRQIAAADERGAVAEAVRRIFGGLFTSRFERVAAAGVLAALGDAGGRTHLVERTGKTGMDRPLAMELCGELGIAEAEPLLVQAAADRKDTLRGTALRALASMQAASAFPSCSDVLLDESEDVDVRSDAAEGLLLLGTAAAEGVLLQAREQIRDQRVGRVVQACLALWGKPQREIRLYLPLSGDELHGD
ncbi:HEAT repeat domain-containing protein [Vulgatibacter sp.]|uniref:HEAT repeat domain-containing protein n=1 Tax=Vulgatibacter sp. TaxID=1971226 RepID=UPI003566D474